MIQGGGGSGCEGGPRGLLPPPDPPYARSSFALRIFFTPGGKRETTPPFEGEGTGWWRCTRPTGHCTPHPAPCFIQRAGDGLRRLFQVGLKLLPIVENILVKLSHRQFLRGRTIVGGLRWGLRWGLRCVQDCVWASPGVHRGSFRKGFAL